MTYDSQVPLTLKKTQEWFASIITQPIDLDSHINPTTPLGNPIEEEAKQYIVPSPTLKPYERIQLYNQQYWWRLLSTLHEAFPLVVRLFGYRDFNETIATPYLVKYPPNHWSLNALSDRLPQWVDEEYHKSDRQLVLDAATIDYAYEYSFYAADYPAVGDVQGANNDPTKLLTQQLHLQPHLHLFSLQYDLFSFRDIFIDKEPEYWEENPFPELLKEKQYYFTLYRNSNNYIVWTEVDLTEYLILETFKNGNSIDKAVQWLQDQPGDHSKQAEEKLHYWIKNWVVKRWLAVVPSTEHRT